MQTLNSISRRGFVAGAAALGALSMVGIQGITSSAQADEATDTQCDILVIGGGISGALAALSALDAGADNVTLIEKQGFIGGSAALSSGFMVTVDNDNFADDIDDSWDKMSEVLHSVHDQSPDTTYPNWDRLTNLFAQQSATIDFMVSLGMTAEFGEKSTAVTMWDGEGAGMMLALADALDEKGVNVILDCPAKELLTDDSGAVCGALAEGRDGEVAINAKKVILACGGASHNDEILTSYMPTYPDIDLDNMSAVGNTGDGFVMGKQLGAQFYDTMVFEGGGSSINDDWKAEINPRLSTGGKLLVDGDGKRFMNESPSGDGSNQKVTYYMVQEGTYNYFYIFDTTDEDTNELIETGIEMGAAFFGETPEELAEAAGMDPTTFADTFTTYQASCEAGEDPEFGKDADNLVLYDTTGGLYAVRYRPASWGTIGGIVTDDTFHALNEDNERIENLFAVGEMSNREFFSCFYVGGNSLALNSTAGRIAGATAVAEM